MTSFRKTYSRLLPVLMTLLIAALACNAPNAPSLEEETATALFATLQGALTVTPAGGSATSIVTPSTTPTRIPPQPTPTLFIPPAFTPRPATATTAPTHIPPTHTATPNPVDFTAVFVKTWKCTAFNVATYQITNTGTLPIESVSIQQEGPPGNEIGGDDTKNRPFKTSDEINGPDCIGDGAETLGAGSSAYVYHRAPNPPDTGTSGAATITVCTVDGLDGACVTKTITFTWP